MNRRERRRQAKETKSAGRGGKAVNHGIRGEQLAGLGKIDDAIKAFRRAIAIDPDYADAHYNLGVLLRRQGRLMEAAESYLRATALQPDNVDAQYNLGNALQDIGRLEDAVASYGKALVLKPDFAEVHNNLGLALKDLGRLDEAVASYRKSLVLKPDCVEAHNNLGIALKDLGRLDEAVDSHRKALAIKSDDAEAHNNLGAALKDLGRLDEAVESHRKALALKPDHAEAHSNLGNALKDLGALDEAAESYKKAISIKADFAEAFSNLGTVLRDQGKLDEAFASLQKAISFKPDNEEAHWNLSLVLLQQGDLKKGWEEYEWGLKIREARGRTLRIEPWRGSALQGKNIVVYAEQGVGDEIMFSGCIPDLLELSPKKIFLECDPRLKALFARSFPGVHVCGKKRDQDLSWVGRHVHLDYSIPIGSLPKFFRNRVEDFPERDSFLVPDSKLVEKWTQRLACLGEGLKIGISWRGGGEKVIKRGSIPLADWTPLLSMNASFINLQYGDTSDEIAQVSDQKNIQIHDWEDNDPLKDLNNQAALISVLDLVITVDNATIHSSGALGTPAWNMMDTSINCMWFNDSESSTPLYPNVRLFWKQPQSGWSDVLKSVEKELRNKIKAM